MSAKTSTNPYQHIDDEKLKLIQQIQEREELIDAISAQGLLPFLNQIIIDSSPEPRPFREIANKWQWGLASRFNGAIEDVAGLPASQPYVGPRNFWFTMPRGHDKTGLIGRTASWLLCYSRRMTQITTAASDKDQAGLIIESMSREARLNPWYGKKLSFSNYTVTNKRTGSTLEALASDAASSMGGKPHVLICDELTWWQKRQLWDALASSKIKRTGCVHLVITNAGLIRSWQHDLLLNAKANPGSWSVYEAPGPIASWMTPERIEEDSKELLPTMKRRVFNNEWLDPSEGSGWVTRAEAVACEELGRRLFLTHKLRGLPDRNYVVAVDYGPSRDRTVIVVLHKEQATEDSPERIIVDRMDVLQGSKTHHVPIDRIEELLDQIIQDFNVTKIVFDRFQMESTIQKFQRKIPVEAFEYRGGKTNYELGQALRSAVVNEQIAWYPDCGALILKNGKRETLTDEFSQVTIKEQQGGYRLMNPPGTHDDRVVALGMGLLLLLKLEKKRDLIMSDYWF